MHKMMVLTTRENKVARPGKEGAKAKAKGVSGKEEVSIICHCLIPDKRILLLGMSDGAILLHQLARDPCDDAWQRQSLEDKKPKRFMPSNGHKGGPSDHKADPTRHPSLSKESDPSRGARFPHAQGMSTRSSIYQPTASSSRAQRTAPSSSGTPS